MSYMRRLTADSAADAMERLMVAAAIVQRRYSASDQAKAVQNGRVNPEMLHTFEEPKVPNMMRHMEHVARYGPQ